MRRRGYQSSKQCIPMISRLANNRPAALLVACLAGTLAVLLFLKNAWVAEDAYILLRSVDQFLAGNGFRWNPHERVQVYTSPLWFLLVVASTVLGQTLYLNLVGLSFALHIGLLAIMARYIRQAWRWAVAVLALTLSQAFFDFTASGLEYPLIYLLVALFVLLYLRERPVDDRYGLALSAGLLLVTRHDLLCLLLPMLLHLAWVYRRALSLRQQCAVLLCLALPLASWTLFSLLYYGVPLPNTAYAKLAIPGLPFAERWHRGLAYLQVSLQRDPLTPLVMAAAVVAGLRAAGRAPRLVAAGLLLGFAYVTLIGGDYMIGRFYAPLYLAAVLLLAVHDWQACPRPGRGWLLVLVPLTAMLLYQLFVAHFDDYVALMGRLGWPLPGSSTPVVWACVVASGVLALAGLARSGWLRGLPVAVFALLLLHSTQQHDSPWQTGYKDWGKTSDHDYWWMVNKVSRERYWIYRWTSLYAWFHRDPARPFPDHPWCHEGIALSSPAGVRFAGMMPYCMGRDRIAIEMLGLADPLLARMPKRPEAEWTSGGVIREIPDGYFESVASGENRLRDPDLRQYYDKLALLTQADTLFSRERLATIVAFNLGYYDHWLRDYTARIRPDLQDPSHD